MNPEEEILPCHGFHIYLSIRPSGEFAEEILLCHRQVQSTCRYKLLSTTYANNKKFPCYNKHSHQSSAITIICKQGMVPESGTTVLLTPDIGVSATLLPHVSDTLKVLRLWLDLDFRGSILGRKNTDFTPKETVRG